MYEIELVQKKHTSQITQLWGGRQVRGQVRRSELKQRLKEIKSESE